MDESEAVARESIRDLVARYNFYGDRGDLASLGAVQTPPYERVPSGYGSVVDRRCCHRDRPFVQLA